MSNFKQQNVAQHKCPNCGATLVFDAESGQLRCEHCEGLVNFEKSDAVVERDFEELVTFKTWKDGDVATFRCSNCGAVEVAPRTALATSCPYCSAPVVIDDDALAVVKPDTIIPFEFSPNQAAAQLTAWRKKKIFAPNKFRKHLKADSVKGVYVPAWTFDAQTSSAYNGTVGYRRTRTVRRDGKTYTETYTEWKHVHGVIPASFDDVTIRANENVPQQYFKQLQPFPQSKYMVFDDEYLAGYLADHYTLEPLEAFEQAKKIMEQDVRRMIVHQHHADMEGNLDVDMQVISKSFKYVFLPVYIAATRYNKKIYNQYVSGIYQNDKKQARVCGKSPVSPWKVLLAVVLGVGVLAAIAYLVLRSGALDEFAQAFGTISRGFLLR